MTLISVIGHHTRLYLLDLFSSASTTFICSHYRLFIAYIYTLLTLINTMDSGSSQDYFLCSHCNEHVSESTFRRHMNVVRRTGFKSNIAKADIDKRFVSGRVSDFSSDSDNECSATVSDNYQYQDQGM